MMFRYLIPAICVAGPVMADPAVVEDVEISGTRVSVTLSHPDTGWDDYADGWRVELEDGTIIGTRELLHPHVNEQPFTRSLTLSDVPNAPLFVRAKTSVEGWADTVFPVTR